MKNQSEIAPKRMFARIHITRPVDSMSHREVIDFQSIHFGRTILTRKTGICKGFHGNVFLVFYKNGADLCSKVRLFNKK